MPYKKRGVLSIFEKCYQEKWKKKPILVYPGLRYTHKKSNFACTICFPKNVCLSTKIILRLKKNTKNFWGQFQKYFAIKKMLVIQFPYMKIV